MTRAANAHRAALPELPADMYWAESVEHLPDGAVRIEWRTAYRDAPSTLRP